MNHHDAPTALPNSTNWRTSSYSQGQNACVEIGRAGETIGVRDSKLGTDSPILTFRQRNWAAFIKRPATLAAGLSD